MRRVVSQFLRITALLALASAAPCHAQEQQRAGLWKSEMTAFEQSDAEEPTEPGGIVFVGSSSIRLWDLAKSFPKVKPTPLNRGFGGSQLEDSIQHAELLILKHKPRLVVVYAGDNDVAAGKNSARVLADFRKLVEVIQEKLPNTTIAYIAIKPSIARWKLAETMRDANESMEAVCQEDARLEFVDIWKPMLGDDGTPHPGLFRDDGLHLNDAGYELWASLVQPLLEAN